MTPEGWRPATYGEAMVETDDRALDAIHLPVLSVTKSRGPMLASERFGRAMHGRDLSKYRVAYRDSIVADPMLLWDGSIGLQTVVDAGLVSPDYRVYRPAADVDPEFLGYVVRSPHMLRHYEGGARGTNVRRNRIARSDFLAIPLFLPSLGEQRKIAAILSSLDDAIEDTQAVIDQLQIVKKVMMADLLTRGLPGRHTRFKSTKIGEVPEEWEVVQVGSILTDGPSNGRSPPSRSTPPGVPTFSIGAVRDGRVNIQGNLKFADVRPEEVRNFIVRTGDILIVRGNGNPELVGRCGVVDEPPPDCIYPDILMRVRPREMLDPGFFVALWNSSIVHEQVIDKAKTTNGTYKINGQDVRSILLPLPSRHEQELIARVFASIQEAQQHGHAELAVRKQLKAALLSALLTGEIRVTPDEASP
ncbi:restriction endonuclease subunit S [Sorangium sp. So ce388]|uniref:restriction endonuclease subunit S n=1 Tax=Sorangium sp. So ce388 TaxID=3133309 RepID=UPI003F5B8A97